MKTMTHTKRMDQPLHIEAPGCIVNIYAGLTDRDGNQVTSVQILCSDYPGDTWRTAEGEKSLNIRVVKQKEATTKGGHEVNARGWELLRSIVKRVRVEYPSADGLVAAGAIELFGPKRFGLDADEIAFCESRGIIKQKEAAK